MKVLSLTQPWAWFVVHGFKAYETRSRNLRPVGELLIHATKEIHEPGRDLYYKVRAEFGDRIFEPFHPPPFDELPRGCIVGIVNHSASMNFRPVLSRLEEMLGNFSEGRWFYYFQNPRFYKSPIPAKGYQCLWRYHGPIPFAASAARQKPQTNQTMISTTENLAGISAGLTAIEQRAQTLETAYQNFDILIGDLEHDLESVKSKHMRLLKKQAATVANLEAELHSTVEQSPDLFKKPRTVTLHGIKLGLQSSIGAVTWNDDDQTVALIKRHLKGRESEFIKTVETPKKDALRSLTPTELAKVGCRIEGAGDQVLIKRLAGEVEKMFGKLIDKLVSAIVGEE